MTEGVVQREECCRSRAWSGPRQRAPESSVSGAWRVETQVPGEGSAGGGEAQLCRGRGTVEGRAWAGGGEHAFGIANGLGMWGAGREREAGRGGWSE